MLGDALINFAAKHAKGMSLRYDAPPIVTVINHRICQCKKNSGIFIFTFSDNLISEDWFFAEGERFYPFGDATALAGEGGVGGVVWLIQASA